MARTARRASSHGYYHVILRGVNKQVVFYDDQDRQKMLNSLLRYQEQTEVTLIAYCLMSNHIHLLVHAETQMDVFMKKLASSYVYYFNHKYERVGHLFQDRFKSEAIEGERHLMAVFRYILQNPWKAGICRPEEYRWSSWPSLYGDDRLCDITPLCGIAGDLQTLSAFVLLENSDEYMEYDSIFPLTDAKAIEIILKITDGDNPQKVADYPKERRKAAVGKMKKAGLSVRQISRLTGLNRNVIQRTKESRNLSL